MIRGLDALHEARGHVAALADLDDLVADLLRVGMASGLVSSGQQRIRDGRELVDLDWRPSALLETQFRGDVGVRTSSAGRRPIPVMVYWPKAYLEAALGEGVAAAAAFKANYLHGHPGLLDATPEQVTALVAGHAHAVAVTDYLTRLNRVVLPAIAALDPARKHVGGSRIGWDALDKADAVPGLPWSELLRYDTDEFAMVADEQSGAGPRISWATGRGDRLLGRYAGMPTFTVTRKADAVRLAARLPNAPKRATDHASVRDAQAAAHRLLVDFLARVRHEEPPFRIDS